MIYQRRKRPSFTDVSTRPPIYVPFPMFAMGVIAGNGPFECNIICALFPRPLPLSPITHPPFPNWKNGHAAHK